MSQIIYQLIEEGLLKEKEPVPMRVFENLSDKQVSDLKERGVTRVLDGDVLYEIRAPVGKIGSLKDEDVSVFEISKHVR